jgi:acyl carrier protein
VRRDTVDYYLGNPHELHNPRRPGKKLLTPESTRDLGGSIIANTGLRAAHSKRSVYRWSLNGIKTEVETSEKNIAQVMEAASNYDLNPHLFGNEIEEAPEPEPIMPKNLVNIISSVISSGKKKKKQNPIDLDRPLTGQELIELDYRIETEFDLKLAPEELQGVSVVRDLARLVIKMIDPEQETISEIVSQG